MAYTYTDPSTIDKDKIRLLVGDTDESDFYLHDGEITWLLTDNGTINATASEACKAIAAKLARKVSQNVGGVALQAQQRFEHYMQLADEYTANQASDAVSPYLGGYKRSLKDAIEEDSDREKIFGRKGVHDNPAYETIDAASTSWNYS